MDWMRSMVATGLVLAGCSAADEGAGGEYMDEDFPPWTCDTEGTTTGCDSSTGDASALQCQGPGDCPSGVCAADFAGDIGRFECQAACIEPLDDARWCFDASACCDAQAICDRGYCTVPEGADTTGLDTTGAGADTTGGLDTTGV
jgi:hypothetical protein